VADRNLKCESWAITLRDELFKMVLGYIWLHRNGRDLKDIYQIKRRWAMHM
jgi:hypothetical protein